ncbi:MAG: DUF2891 domain-containing protein [Sphingomonas sanxanigenens]|uniref:DUF2891 domain-containing protein n=1 Tax=Sphingomonas sanxanigenens TaxID=397260 RepID=A0A2W5C8P5_9SPHN|nr:MAG: DUF2891 domain-containing protein [Sphingomonas sanxanigenens]
MTHSLTPEIAARFATIALGHVTREYPHKLDQVLTGPEELEPPSILHPIFYGSFDWHSCVHGYWLLLTLRRLYPDMQPAAAIEDLADRMLTAGKVAGELDYLDRAYTGGFERPYGWAWLLMLHREAQRHEDRGWAEALAPLARAFADRFLDFLPRQTYAIRTGTHYSTAFAMILALEWAEANDPALAELIRARAQDYYAADRDCPAWEPEGDTFLSPALVEALCMKRCLPADAFAPWLAHFLPRLNERQPASLFTPATVSDRSDGKIAHLDGTNLSRAWCWRELAGSLPVESRAVALTTADAHLDAALPHVAGDYMGEHWLASFALLALEAPAT